MSTLPGLTMPRMSALGRDAVLPAAILMLVLFMVVPLPAIILDIGFILSIMLSLLVLMVALNVAKPLDFSAFPTVLLFATLFRLALNVASTRVVLVDGHTGTGAAGHVIEAFGSFLIGGDYAVGIFVFAILMIINLVVITKGAGRVSEVSARFVLDALPGKQMAIDADLNAGLSSPEESKARRIEVATEADFYGSMDGSSKFVKGDAVAGVLILLVNIFGGLILGTLSHGLSLGEAASIYVLLAIGDALVAQIPALLLSIAAASIVTRVNSPFDLAGQISSQFLSPKAWLPVAAILTILGLIPGMPHVIILPFAGLAGFAAWKLARQPVPAEGGRQADTGPDHDARTVLWEDIAEDTPISLELGLALIGLVDERKDAPLMSRITGIRRQLSKSLGFVVPMVRVRDELNLPPNSYRIMVNGVIVGEDEAWPGEYLALSTDDSSPIVFGRAAKDPAFGLNAAWITPGDYDTARAEGFTVVDAATVIATHLNQLIQKSSADLFGMDEAQALLDTLKESAPHLVANLTPSPLPLATIAGLCRALLSEHIPLKDFRRIAQAMVDAARTVAEPAQLIEAVRALIGALIVQTIVGAGQKLRVITLAPKLEQLLHQAVRLGKGAVHPIEPALADKIIRAVGEIAVPSSLDDQRLALATSPTSRAVLFRLLSPHFPELPVLSFLEIPESKAVEVIAVVGEGALDALPAPQGEWPDHDADPDVDIEPDADIELAEIVD
ncbi:MAG: flagellar biosynthesis protein FlhA [Sphingopyxis sp.]